MSQNGLLATPNGLVKSEKMNNDITPKPVIERGASWSYNETRILLSLWGQDMVQRQLTNSKRTRHVWEKIAERIKEHGYERTPGKRTKFYYFFLPVNESINDEEMIANHRSKHDLDRYK